MSIIPAMPQPSTWDSDLTWDAPGATWDGFVAAPPTPLTAMASDNRISVEITAQDKTAIAAAIQSLKTLLQPYLINLTVEERQSLPRLGDRSLAFDSKCEAYMANRPDLVPGFLNLTEMAKDRKLVADLLPCLRELAPLCEGLEDTVMLANSDNMNGDLAFYQSVRQAAKRGVAGTDTIYNDLKERFPGRPRQDPPAPTP